MLGMRRRKEGAEALGPRRAAIGQAGWIGPGVLGHRARFTGGRAPDTTSSVEVALLRRPMIAREAFDCWSNIPDRQSILRQGRGPNQMSKGLDPEKERVVAIQKVGLPPTCTHRRARLGRALPAPRGVSGPTGPSSPKGPVGPEGAAWAEPARKGPKGPFPALPICACPSAGVREGVRAVGGRRSLVRLLGMIWTDCYYLLRKGTHAKSIPPEGPGMSRKAREGPGRFSARPLRKAFKDAASHKNSEQHPAPKWLSLARSG